MAPPLLGPVTAKPRLSMRPGTRICSAMSWSMLAPPAPRVPLLRWMGAPVSAPRVPLSCSLKAMSPSAEAIDKPSTTNSLRLNGANGRSMRLKSPSATSASETLKSAVSVVPAGRMRNEL